MKTITKQALSLLLALVLILGLVPGTAWAAEETVPIASAEELAAFRDRVNDGENTLNARLTADITLTGDWTPFNPSGGYVSSAYAGTFDGDGHTIRGLSINDAGISGVGFFGTVNGAAIKNLVLEGTVTASNSAFVGGIVGKTGGTVTIENCSFAGSVTSSKTGTTAGAGGIVGRVNAGSVTITNCANTAGITGGAAGGILGYLSTKGSSVENCYSTGTVSGSNRTGGIAGQVYSTTAITNCYTTTDVVSGFNGVLTNCYDSSDLPTDASALGDAFTTDAQGGIILTWQAGTSPAPKDPHITISGGSTLSMTNSGPQPETTLSVRYVDMEDEPAVTWAVKDSSDIINIVSDGTSAVIQAVKPGKAVVIAEANGYSAEQEITVYPFITTAEIDGIAAAGQTVKAKLNVFGGGEFDYNTFPEVTVQWRRLSAEDYSAGNTANYQNIQGAAEREFTIPEAMAGDYLSFIVRYNGRDLTPNRTYQILASAPPVTPDPGPEEKPEFPDLTYYKMYPVFGTDRNAVDVLKAYLSEKGYSDIGVSLKTVTEVHGGAGIDASGDITYFYTDPNTTPAVRNGSYQVTFTLTKDGVSQDIEIPVILHWDADKVKEIMTKEILSKVTIGTQEVTENFDLPKVVDNKRWTLIEWSSSSDAISISTEKQTTADTLFDPYVGVVKRGSVSERVTLTARFSFQFSDSSQPIVLYKTFEVTVPPLGDAQAEAVRQALLAKLDQGFRAKGLRSAFTGETLTPDADGSYTTTDDIQFPTTQDFGVDGKYYPVTITTDNTAVLQAPDVKNAARTAVYRPGPGQADAEGSITVSIQDKDSGITASRTFQIKVPALTQAEVDAELSLMAQVKASYFEGIKGENDSRDNVRSDLTPFFEVYEKDGALVWVRSAQDMSGRGIVPVPMEGWEELEQWRLFRSSNPNVISHETLQVTRQKEAKAVTVTSRLSSETLGRYGALYQNDPVRFAQYETLAPLYYQEVSTDADAQPLLRTASLKRSAAADTIVVRGTRDPESAEPVAETFHVTFSLQGLDGAYWIGTTSLTELEETVTVYDVFQTVLNQEGYTWSKTKGTYITAVTGPKGTLAERDHGANSGWLYRVNGKLPEVYMGACGLHSGDVIQVFYTTDASKETDIWDWTPPSSGSSTSGGSSSGKPAQPTQPTQPTQPEQPGQSKAVSITLTTVEDPPVYTDASTHWAKDAIAFVSAHALFQGVSQDRFAPDVPMTRGMLSTVLHRLSGSPQSGSAAFADVAADAWYAPGIAWASELGIVTGYAADAFGPKDPLTREQLAVMLYRYAKLLKLDTTVPEGKLDPYADSAAVSSWARDALSWAVETGLLTGTSDTTLAPGGSATRAQTAVVLQRLAGLAGE